MQLTDLFSLLEMEPTDEWDKVRAQARKLILRYHPDVHSEKKYYFEERTKQLLYAYETLKQHFTKETPLPSVPRPEPSPPPIPNAFLTFLVSNKRCAFPIQQVEEVAAGDSIATQGRFLGRIQSRLGTLPVFSLFSILSLSETQPPLSPSFDALRRKVIVLKDKERKAGFLVSDVLEVVTLVEKEFVTTPVLPSLQPFLLRVAVREEHILLILSPTKLLQSL